MGRGRSVSKQRWPTPWVSCFPSAAFLDAQNQRVWTDPASESVLQSEAKGSGHSQAITSLGILEVIMYCVKTESTVTAERQELPGCSALFPLMLPGALASLVPPQLLNFIFASAPSHEQLPRPHTHHLHTRTHFVPAPQAPRFLDCLHPLTPPVCLSVPHPDGLIPPCSCGKLSAVLLT